MGAENPKRRVPPGLLFVCFLALGAFAALQAHRLWIAPGERRVPAAARAPAADAATRPAPDAKRLLHDPLSVAGLERLDGEPGGVPPPTGARRTGAYQRSRGGVVEQVATYALARESLSAAGEHYRRAFAAAGFEPAGERQTDGERVLVFRRGEAQAVVALRPGRQKEKMDKLTLSVILPAEQTGESGEEP